MSGGGAVKRPSTADAVFEELCRRFFPGERDRLRLMLLRGAIEWTEMTMASLVGSVAEFMRQPNADWNLGIVIADAEHAADELEFAAWALRRFAAHYREQVDERGTRRTTNVLKFEAKAAESKAEETAAPEGAGKETAKDDGEEG